MNTKDITARLNKLSDAAQRYVDEELRSKTDPNIPEENSWSLKSELESDVNYIIETGVTAISDSKDYEFDKIEKIEVINFTPVGYTDQGNLAGDATPMKLRVTILLDTSAAVGAEDVAEVKY